MVKPPFCAWCPLTNRRKTGCKAELFLKNPKNYFEGFFSGASRISRVWGRHSPTRFPQGQNERKANFGTAVESCSPWLQTSSHFRPPLFRKIATRKIHFSFAYYSFIKSRFWQAAFLFLLLIIRQRTFLPVFAKMATDTELPTWCRRKPFSLSVIQKNENWQPGRQKIFLFTLNTTALPVLPKMGAKKHHGFQKICGVAAWSIFNLYQQKTVIYIWILLTNVIDSGVAFSDS